MGNIDYVRSSEMRLLWRNELTVDDRRVGDEVAGEECRDGVEWRIGCRVGCFIYCGIG
jgi:hypothetical protein